MLCLIIWCDERGGNRLLVVQLRFCHIDNRQEKDGLKCGCRLLMICSTFYIHQSFTGIIVPRNLSNTPREREWSCGLATWVETLLASHSALLESLKSLILSLKEVFGLCAPHRSIVPRSRLLENGAEETRRVVESRGSRSEPSRSQVGMNAGRELRGDPRVRRHYQTMLIHQ